MTARATLTQTFLAGSEHGSQMGDNWERAAGILVALSDHDLDAALTFDGSQGTIGAFVFTVRLRGYDLADVDRQVAELRTFRYGVHMGGTFRDLVTFDWQVTSRTRSGRKAA